MSTNKPQPFGWNSRPPSTAKTHEVVIPAGQFATDSGATNVLTEAVTGYIEKITGGTLMTYTLPECS